MKPTNEEKEKIKDFVSNVEDKQKLGDGAKQVLKSPAKFSKVFRKLCRRCLAISVKCVKKGKAEEALSQYCPRCKKLVEDLK